MRNVIKSVVFGTALAVVAVAAPARAADPVGTDLCTGIRPGAVIEAPANNFYTMAFLFRDQYGARYVSTVGNFVLAAPGSRVWKGNLGPKAMGWNRKFFGRFVYAKYTETPAFDTFALVRLNKGVRYGSSMCHFGGPTGIYTSKATGLVQMNYYGQGTPFDGSLPARTAIGTGTSDPAGVVGLGLPGIGDEGAPVVVGGKALGIVTGDFGSFGENPSIPPEAGNFLVTRMTKWVTAAQKALHVKLYLLTAKKR